MEDKERYSHELREEESFRFMDYSDPVQWDPMGNPYHAVIEERMSHDAYEREIWGPAGRYGEY